MKYFVDGIELDERGRLTLVVTDDDGVQTSRPFAPHLLYAVMIKNNLCRDPRDGVTNITRVIHTKLTQEDIDAL